MPCKKYPFCLHGFVWYSFNFLGFLQQTCQWQTQNMLLERIQSFNSFVNGVWEWKWVEWSDVFLEEGLFTVWIPVESLTYFVTKSMSVKTEMCFFPLPAGREVVGELCTNTRGLWNLCFTFTYVRLSTEYHCFFDQLLEHLLLLALWWPPRHLIPFASAANCVYLSVMFPIISPDKSLCFLTSVFNPCMYVYMSLLVFSVSEVRYLA